MGKPKPVFNGKLLRVYTKRVLLPNGYSVCLEMIKHPGAALVVPFLSSDRIILLKQFRPVVDRYLYEAPAGTLAKKEPPLACARREIVEETGYSAGRFIRLGEIYAVPGYSTEKIAIYKAWRLKKRSRVPEKDEVIETLVVSRRRVKALFRKGAITDAKTICALSMCGWL
ncbi:MAG: NUDIX hydrolase [Candidatus Omnitrophica bacterium]|nr:NUDIX hydrolase [Candidatus Omnitrophota bacterium]